MVRETGAIVEEAGRRSNLPAKLCPNFAKQCPDIVKM